MQVMVGKWGNNLAVRFPSDVVQAAKLHDSERVDIEVADGAIVIRRAEPRLTLAALFDGHSPAEWRAAYAHAYDWGEDAGREAVPE